MSPTETPLGEEHDHEGEPYPSYDEKAEEAVGVLTELFAQEPPRVYYTRQIAVLLEKRFYHWVTKRALKNLVSANVVGTDVLPLTSTTPIRFFWPHRLRYWRRQAMEIRKLVLEFSGTDFGHALGQHGETMFDAALPRMGFIPPVPNTRNINSYGGKTWTKTDHDLDRVFQRDGVAYGTEIKNALDYIEPDELRVKLEICETLGLRPLFILRMAPKSYIYEVEQAGGFALIFKFQFYPHGAGELAKRVRTTLGLPVDSPAAVWDATVERLLRWHLRTQGLPLPDWLEPKPAQ